MPLQADVWRRTGHTALASLVGRVPGDTSPESAPRFRPVIDPPSSTVTQVHRGSTLALSRSTLDSCRSFSPAFARSFSHTHALSLSLSPSPSLSSPLSRPLPLSCVALAPCQRALVSSFSLVPAVSICPQSPRCASTLPSSPVSSTVSLSRSGSLSRSLTLPCSLARAESLVVALWTRRDQ